MKEIDKIRIRQWNQDNPYIQMKNLENRFCCSTQTRGLGLFCRETSSLY